MAESSLYTQRLEAIVGRRKVQERILRTRRELEEEKLRAQQLKRKSLRDRWLMEGTCLPLEENDPTAPLQQTQSRIQELEQDLSSLQSQMQQLDNPERQERLQEDPKQPAGETCEALGAGSAAGGEGGCSSRIEPALRLAPVPPKRATRAAPRETLENGDVSGAVEGFSPVLVETEANSAAPGTPGICALPLNNGVGATAASAKQLEKPGVGKAELIIRNHLGQEVGSMDAIGQMLLGPEEEAPGAENGLEEAWDRNREQEQQVLDGGMEERTPETAGLEKSVAREGSREGPEGESWVPEGEVQTLMDENGCLDFPRPRPDGELEELIGVMEEGEILAELATGTEEAEDARAAQDSTAEPQLGPTQGRGPAGQDCAREEERQECPGAEHPQATGMGEGAETKASLQGQSPGNQIPSALQDQIPLSRQGQIPSLQEAKIPSLQEAKAALQDQIPSVQDQISCSLQEVKASLQDQIPSVQDQIPIALQEAQTSLQDQIPSALQEANISLQDQIPSTQEAKADLQDQIPSMQAQVPSALQEANTPLQNQIPSPKEAKHALESQIPSSQEQVPAVHGEVLFTHGEMSSAAPTLEQAPALPSKSSALKGGSDVGPISLAAEETTENLGKLPLEQQPLLTETSGIRMGRREPLGSVARSPQQEAGTVKSQEATTSANTASLCQGRSAPGDGQETGRRKQKSCECCCVM
uniref:Paralemmin-3 n=1 Tax=Pelusios castaneus TaxID=367368 RepID=A0A8C8SKW5_9SAUR